MQRASFRGWIRSITSSVSETPVPDIGVSRTWESRADEAYRRIRTLILDGSMPPNSTVIEARLVRILARSRTPVREALHRMEAEGLLKALPRGGFTVAARSADRDFQLFVQKPLVTAIGHPAIPGQPPTNGTTPEPARKRRNTPLCLRVNDVDDRTPINHKIHGLVGGIPARRDRCRRGAPGVHCASVPQARQASSPPKAPRLPGRGGRTDPHYG